MSWLSSGLKKVGKAAKNAVTVPSSWDSFKQGTLRPIVKEGLTIAGAAIGGPAGAAAGRALGGIGGNAVAGENVRKTTTLRSVGGDAATGFVGAKAGQMLNRIGGFGGGPVDNSLNGIANAGARQSPGFLDKTLAGLPSSGSAAGGAAALTPLDAGWKPDLPSPEVMAKTGSLGGPGAASGAANLTLGGVGRTIKDWLPIAEAAGSAYGGYRQGQAADEMAKRGNQQWELAMARERQMDPLRQMLIGSAGAPGSLVTAAGAAPRVGLRDTGNPYLNRVGSL
jgi:hypothetical protein